MSMAPVYDVVEFSGITRSMRTQRTVIMMGMTTMMTVIVVATVMKRWWCRFR